MMSTKLVSLPKLRPKKSVLPRWYTDPQRSKETIVGVVEWIQSSAIGPVRKSCLSEQSFGGAKRPRERTGTFGLHWDLWLGNGS